MAIQLGIKDWNRLSTGKNARELLSHATFTITGAKTRPRQTWVKYTLGVARALTAIAYIVEMIGCSGEMFQLYSTGMHFSNCTTEIGREGDGCSRKK